MALSIEWEAAVFWASLAVAFCTFLLALATWHQSKNFVYQTAAQEYRELAYKVYQPLRRALEQWYDERGLLHASSESHVFTARVPMRFEAWEKIQEAEAPLVFRIPSGLKALLDEAEQTVNALSENRRKVYDLAWDEYARQAESLRVRVNAQTSLPEIKIHGVSGLRGRGVDIYELWAKKVGLRDWIKTHLEPGEEGKWSADLVMSGTALGGLDEAERLVQRTIKVLEANPESQALRSGASQLPALARRISAMNDAQLSRLPKKTWYGVRNSRV